MMLQAQIDTELKHFVVERMMPMPSAATRACSVWRDFTQWLTERHGVAVVANKVSKIAVARSLRRLGYQMERGRDGMYIIGFIIRTPPIVL